MRIDELVSMDTEGAFRSDVKLNDYENPTLNRDLLRNYIFTTHAPVAYSAAQRSLSSKDVLEHLRSQFSFRGENRIALIANYGHGKSHLALVLANFFACPAESEEVRIVLNRLGQALNNPAQLAGYRDFKKSKGEFLVVRLQGDAVSDLQEGFVNALEQALGEHNATRDMQIPFWYKQAQAWLETLKGQTRERAEAYLAGQHTDLESLKHELRREGSYELTRELAKHITGVYPDFGREINLAELIEWAVDEVCKARGLGGVLVLFDEFSLFLQKYARARTAGKLQELLNGISNREGQSAFLAFSQHDLDTVAETYADENRRKDIAKELSRLPVKNRIQLYSLMESVLGSYLKQNHAAWQSWLTQRPVRAAMARGRESVVTYFGKRYSEDLGWNPETVSHKIVEGCFPLHPLTTAILSTHTFESGTGEDPRTALQFVRWAWEDLRQQSALLPDEKPRFVFAIALVDFFGQQISKSWYAAYRNATETSPIPLNQEHRAVLKALLLAQVVTPLETMKPSRNEQLELLSALCGLEGQRLKDILRELSNAKVIQYDPYNRRSSLYPVSARPQEVEDLINKAVEAIPSDKALERIASTLPGLELPLTFGNAEDWKPQQVTLTTDWLMGDALRLLIRFFGYNNSGIEDHPRGLVIWLIAQSEEERLQLRRNAQSTLDDAIADGDYPLPIVMIMPKQTTPGLLIAAQRVIALENLKTDEREKIGTMILQQEKAFAQRNLVQALDDLTGELQNHASTSRNVTEYVLPHRYQASVQALKNLSLRTVVTECYRQAYAWRVEFSDKPVGGKGVNQLRIAVQGVARWLFSDTAGKSIGNLASKDMKYQVADYYLTQKWGLLAAETYAIQQPTSLALQNAWNLLESTFTPGCKDISAREVVLSLFNPPYGHDYNTLTLLLAAWIGFHQHEITLSLAGKRISLKDLQEHFDTFKRPQDFLASISIISPLTISRSKPDELFAQARTIVEKIRQGTPFSIPEAQAALADLEQSLASPRLPQARSEEINRLRPRLEEALHIAQDYDDRAADWSAQLASASFDDLLRLRESFKSFPTLQQVVPSAPALSELKACWETAIRNALQSFCVRHESLEDLSDYKAHERELQRARKALSDSPALVQRVDEALGKLAQRNVELKQLEGEKTIITELKGMTPSASLATLYSYHERLSQFGDLSPQTHNLRNEKAQQIEIRIQQYEQVAHTLPEAVENITAIDALRRQRDFLLRNLDQMEGTPFYQSLCTTRETIQQLEGYFEQLRTLQSQPRHTPADLDAIETQITAIEAQYSSWLSPVQRSLLQEQREGIENLRRQKTQEASSWLVNIAKRYQNGENPDTLLRQIENPPAFLPLEDRSRLEATRQAIQKRIDANVLAKIESLFTSIGDQKIRRQCLERLQALMGD